MKTTTLRTHAKPWMIPLATLALFLFGTLCAAGQDLTLVSSAPGIVEVTGPDGQIYWIEATSDFAVWTPLARRALTNGTDRFEDPLMLTAVRQFYRALPQTLVEVAANLWSPTKLIVTPGGSVVVAEAGTGPNTGRITVIRTAAEGRPVLTGLPSGYMPPENAPSGPAGLVLISNALYIAIGAGDSTVIGSSPGREAINPSPSSPLFSAILRCDFDRAIEDLAATFQLTDQHVIQLSQGHPVSLTDDDQSVVIRVIADFVDAVADPNVGARPANLFGMDTDGAHLYVANAGMNQLLKVDLADGSQSVLATFPGRPNPSGTGPPTIDSVPDDVHCWNGRILVSCLTGFPFLARFADVLEVDPETGVAAPFITGLTLAVAAAASSESPDTSFFVLEYSSGSFGTAGQLLRFAEPVGSRLSLTSSVGNPTGLVVDPERRLIWIADNSGGRVLRLQTW